MRILLMSITAGQGHHSTAKAIRDYFVKTGCDRCEILDAYEYIAYALKEAVNLGYLISTAYTPKAAGKIYTLAENKKKANEKFSISEFTNRILSLELEKYLNDYHPDVIICTHVFAAGIVNSLKKKNKLDALLIGVVTDFTIHPFWQDMSFVDYFVIASEFLTYQAGRKYIPKEKLLTFGIPINPKFSSGMDKKQARRVLGLDENKQTLLVMSGSMGFGKIDEVMKKLDCIETDFQALVVCGNNKMIRKKIEKVTFHKDFRVFGYVDNVDLMMDAADCIITKPGGLTTSEAMAKGLPMIMVNPIPGQEQRNVEFMQNMGLAMYATDTYPVDEAVHNLFTNPYRLKTMREGIEVFGKKDSTKKLCEFVVNAIQKND